MTLKKKSLITIFLSTFIALIVAFGCFFTISQPAYADEEEYVWVDLQPGDIVGGKHLRFESAIAYIPNISITFENGYSIGQMQRDPLTVKTPDDTALPGLSEQLTCIWEGEYVTDSEGMPYWWITEYYIPEVLSVSYDMVIFDWDLTKTKVSKIDINRSYGDVDYGVKIKMLMDKDEAIASGRIEGDINNGHSLLSLILPIAFVGSIACFCLFILNKNKKRYGR